MHICQPTVHPTPEASPLIPLPEVRFCCGRGLGRSAVDIYAQIYAHTLHVYSFRYIYT